MAAINFAGKITFPNRIDNVSYGACMISKIDNCIWIIDSGATDHITFNKVLLFNIKPLPIPYLVSILNGYKVKVSCTGSLHFLSFTLHHVLYIPSFHYNLISISKFVCQLDCSVLFTKLNCLIQAPSLKRPVVAGKLQNGLYKLLHSSSTIPDSPHSHSPSSVTPIVDVADSSMTTFHIPANTTACVSSSTNVLSCLDNQSILVISPSAWTASVLVPSIPTCTISHDINKMDILWHNKLGTCLLSE